MKSWRRHVGIWALCALVLVGPVRAWEFEDAVPLPQFAVGARPDQVSLERVSLSVKGQVLSLRYEWRNQGDAADADLAIYLSPFDWQGAAAEYGDRHFPELTVLQDGRPVALRRQTMAFHGGRELGALLRQGGIDPLLVAQSEVLSAPMAWRSRRVWRRLVSMGAAHELDGMFMPDWFVQSLPSWRMHWPAGQASVLELRHKARPAFAPWETGSPQLNALLSAHCTSLTQLRADFDAHHWRWPEYVVVQRFDVPLGGRGWHVDHVELNFDPRSEWSGLTPRASYMCKPSGDSLSGWPNIVESGVPVSEDKLSILLILPQ